MCGTCLAWTVNQGRAKSAMAVRELEGNNFRGLWTCVEGAELPFPNIQSNNDLIQRCRFPGAYVRPYVARGKIF